MTVITASSVAELRAKTDAPMMECKKALTEAGGDMSRAEEILRIKLGNKANKAAARAATEGVVAIHISADRKLGAILEMNSETDFVARNQEFLDLGNLAATQIAVHNPVDVVALEKLPANTSSGTIGEARTALVGKIGENMNFRRFARLTSGGQLASYIHGGAKIGVLVDITGGSPELGRDIAMHIAATRPLGLSAKEVPPDVLERERKIARAKAEESGKPPAMIDKIVEGSVQKYIKEVTLLEQAFVKNDKETISQLLKNNQASINAFVLYVVGEGMEKKVTDFAAEVAAQAAAVRAK